MTAATDNWTLDALLEPWLDSGVPAIAVHGVNLDSRLVVPGDLYLAVAGAETHGLRFAGSAVDKGAVAVMTSPTEQPEFVAMVGDLQSRGIPVIMIGGLERICADIASRFYDNPDQALTVIAVTGTDGKTSVCRFIAQALSANDHPCGYIGTLGWGLQGELSGTQLTTPDSVSLRRMLAVMRKAGARSVALEASSHGIAEGRLDGLSLDIAVLTNLGRDHLDYHGTLEAYREAKERLFRWRSLKALVLNADDQMGQDLLGSRQPVPCFAYSAAGKPVAGWSVRALNVVTDDSGIAFELVEGADAFPVSSPLLGRFNVDNLLACYASLRACGLAANDATHCIAQVTPVAGRMERLGGGDSPTVVIDYSHTPGALKVAIEAVRVHCKGRLWVVFGCGGDRDPGKRVPMAKAAQAADQVVLTNDNPRTEDAASIIRDVLSGFDTREKVVVIADRAEAIRHAVASAQVGDLVLIAGKGHENYQIIGTQRFHFSDREQAQALLGFAS